jgi:hypothetical protein
MITKIKELFDSVKCFPEVILETDRAGEEVDNGCGVEFKLPQYAVIHSGDAFNISTSKKIYEFESENSIDIMKFNVNNCTSIEEMVSELNENDGYVVKWERS